MGLSRHALSGVLVEELVACCSREAGTLSPGNVSYCSRNGITNTYITCSLVLLVSYIALPENFSPFIKAIIIYLLCIPLREVRACADSRVVAIL